MFSIGTLYPPDIPISGDISILSSGKSGGVPSPLLTQAIINPPGQQFLHE
jgi:hypothetical protein